VSALVKRVGLRLEAEPVRFSFDGREYEGQRGDTAASALYAAGVRLFGRSVKYRRPRGLLALGPEEPNALLTVGEPPALVPNVPAPLLEIADRLVLRSQNRWPSLRFDVASVLQAGGGFFGAGFYYKTFIWPSWRCYEGLIRRLAGLGEAPGAAPLGPPSIEHLSCDVLVGGGGPAGIAAALAAAHAGARVVLCEREPELGGELEFEQAMIDGRRSADWVGHAESELVRMGVRVLAQTAIVGGSDGLVIAHGEPGGLPGRNHIHRIRPKRFVMAFGATERPIAFVDNDRPGVMLLGAAERLAARFGVRAGRRCVLFGNHDRLYFAAARLLAAGTGITAIVDTRPRSDVGSRPATERVRAELERAGVIGLCGHAVLAAEGAPAVTACRVAPVADPAGARRIECDAILVSGGWSPAVHAALHEGGVRRFAADAQAFVADAQPAWRRVAGAAAGAADLAGALGDGHAAGERAARDVGAIGAAGAAHLAQGDPPPALAPFWRSTASLDSEKRQFVDLQNDVTVADLRQALTEGFVDIEHVKRYTTLGVGTEQGRTSGVLGAAIVAELRGETLAEVGVSRTRPPYHPISLASLAGHRHGTQLRVMRRTPMHEWHEAHGGVLEPAAYWMRTRYYRANGVDAFHAGIAEAGRVRSHGGILDGSTLGKIEVAGPRAAEFLDRLYLARASTIKPGRSKYMVNLREDGMVLDDGLVLRLGEQRFLATTGSGHAEHMLAHFERYRDLEWSGADVALANVTEAWAVIVVSGPRSRVALSAVLGAQWQAPLIGLRHMEFVAGEYHGEALRVLRASFSGELAFELHCRPAIALPLWQALYDAGLPPYGLEALDILRIEKGYLVGSEMNGQATPHDLGMAGLVALGNACVGRELLGRPGLHEPTRPMLVGVRAADGKATIPGGAQITSASEPSRSLGHVSSSAYSPALGQWIGLAFVARQSAAEGTLLVARDPLRQAETPVRVTATAHFDQDSKRMKS
jgi:sarcosine oxidase subunit alpha